MFAASLPDLDSLDLEAAKALLIARSTEIERLVLLVEKLQRMLFGTKSEKVLLQIEQLELQLEELQAVNAIEERAAAASAARPIAAKPFRRPLPEHLPREIHTHMPSATARADPAEGQLQEFGTAR
jgi:transposase